MISLGCPKNLVDAEIMLGTLAKDEYEVTDDPSAADAIIVNTCSFIEDSRKESVQTILEMAQVKGDDKNKKLIVSGCLPQRYKDELVESLPEADIFIGSGEFQNIAQILKDHREGKTEQKFYHLPTFLQQKETPRLISGPKHRAYLKISEGCKKRCAFCAIPKIRGNLQSRTVDGVISEAKLLVASGVKELIVVSHDFTDYGWDIRRKDPTAPETNIELLKKLSEVDGAEWIRIMYMYPDGITPELLQLMKDRPNILPYFDMPLQHISDGMLKAMNRKMTKAEIVERLNWIRKEMPDAVIRTQFIVGFPGETEEDFQELKEFVRDFSFDRVGCFKYSPEESTAGGRMQNQIDEETKQRRHDELMEIQQDISYQMHRRFVGRTIQVLVEGYSEETDLLLQGRMSGQAPEIDGVVLINEGEAEVGDLVSVLITDSHAYDLVGTIVKN
ncbi:MAG: 30S ribosomal protein S12 methylthiotransferase RimO [Bdellovibrionales bacterium]|nr:30S ribosomal protein S12 methylthiotransferase RimO [Bdellovibrionales bacterium]